LKEEGRLDLAPYPTSSKLELPDELKCKRGKSKWEITAK
jgi:hypothetical protein